MFNISALALSPILLITSQLNAWADQVGISNEMVGRIVDPLPMIIKPIAVFGAILN